MIARLFGTVVTQGDEGVVTVDVSGVGYEVTVPLGSLGRATKEPDGRTVLHVHTVVREDALQLFGFPSIEDRQVFRTLIAISGVGPKTAVAILGALSTEELVAAVTRKEVSKFTSITGVGKKTAERLLLELKDKIAGFGATSSHLPQVQGHSINSGKGELLRSALVNMGFRPIEVDRAVDTLADRIPREELPELIRDALAIVRQ